METGISRQDQESLKTKLQELALELEDLNGEMREKDWCGCFDQKYDELIVQRRKLRVQYANLQRAYCSARAEREAAGQPPLAPQEMTKEVV